MTDTYQPVNAFAPIRNMALLYNLAQSVIEADPRLPRIAVFSCPSGYGKTHGSIYTTNKTEAARVEVQSTWTGKRLLQNIFAELGGTRKSGSVADYAEWVIGLLIDAPGKPLIIDEADKLLQRKGMLEIVREIHDASQAPIILMGEENLPAKLMDPNLERFSNRVLKWEQGQPCDLQDTDHLARCYCPGLTLDTALMERICKETHGRTRRIVNTLNDVNEFAKKNGLTTVSAEDYTAPAMTGKAPRPRSLG